jgi:hypothetical protein
MPYFRVGPANVGASPPKSVCITLILRSEPL